MQEFLVSSREKFLERRGNFLEARSVGGKRPKSRASALMTTALVLG